MPPPPYSRVNPLLHGSGAQPHQWFDTGIGGPKGPGLPANFHPPSTVAAATVFAVTHIGGSAQALAGQPQVNYPRISATTAANACAGSAAWLIGRPITR
ncbi:MAG TPA: hypothetical protein DDZ74_04775 [Pseudomonas sp.]|nr:hypothetical protein C5609_18305 [Pseudomonas putida]HBK48653.1 hypothetical protein [Pseudomonas sp.]